MKENKIMKFASFILLITVIALILAAGTYAKYTSTATGSDTAVVAKWDIKAGRNGSNLLSIKDGTVTFDLFETINDEATDVAETDVTSGKIAPGTKGEFELVIKNDSELTAQYAIDFTVTKGASVSDANILFSTDEGNTWDDEIVVLASNDTKLAMNGGSDTVKVMWKWAYETTDGDVTDTKVGTNATVATEEAAKTITVQATLTATQVD